jgi:hypothetical protein
MTPIRVPVFTICPRADRRAYREIRRTQTPVVDRHHSPARQVAGEGHPARARRVHVLARGRRQIHSPVARFPRMGRWVEPPHNLWRRA